MEGEKEIFFPIHATVKGSPIEKAVVKVDKVDMDVVKSVTESVPGRERRGRGETQRDQKQEGDNSWASIMSMDELRGVREQIDEYIEGLRAKGITDPEKYEGAFKKMEVVEAAMWEKENSK